MRTLRILVSTTDADLVRGIAACTDSEMDVLHTWGVQNLVHLIEDGSTRSMVVLDCAHPGVKPHSIAALADDIPELADGVLLGADAVLLADLARISGKMAKWRVCPEGTPLNEVIAHCTRALRQ